MTTDVVKIITDMKKSDDQYFGTSILEANQLIFLMRDSVALITD